MDNRKIGVFDSGLGGLTTVKQIMKCERIVSIVPRAVKADAVAWTLSQPENNMVPATIMKKHPDFTLFVDQDSAAKAKLGDMVLPFEDISAVAVLGKNKLNIYYKDQLFQLKSHKRFCALKYVNLFYRCKNIMRGEQDGKFLGL